MTEVKKVLLKSISKRFDGKYLLNVLIGLLEISGPSKNEGRVIEFIHEEIKKFGIFPCLKIISQPSVFGLLVIVPSIYSGERFILFDSHVDTVQKKHISPIFSDYEEKTIIKSTGLDNKINCAILLSMVKYCQFQNTSYAVLFSVEEEIGQWGARRFSHEINLADNSYFGNPLDLIIVLDVCQGSLEKEKAKQEKKVGVRNLSILGKGFCPKYQSFGNYNFNSRSNISGFWEFRSNYVNTPKVLFSCPCVDFHELESYGCVNDIFGLFNFFTDGEFERMLNANEEEGRFLDYVHGEIKKQKEEDKVREDEILGILKILDLEKREKNQKKEILGEGVTVDKYILEVELRKIESKRFSSIDSYLREVLMKLRKDENFVIPKIFSEISY